MKHSNLFCVTLTSKQDWAEPVVLVIEAGCKTAATQKALKNLGCTNADIKEMTDTADYVFTVTSLTNIFR